MHITAPSNLATMFSDEVFTGSLERQTEGGINFADGEESGGSQFR